MEREFRLTIRLGNREMSTLADVADAIRMVSAEIGSGQWGLYEPADQVPTQSILDFDGNRVGSWSVKDSTSER